MPRFSVIVPAFKVQAYLEECLDSVLIQSYDDLELIVVDDCSPGSSGAVIDAHAARDARVAAVRLTRNTGPGPARNAGATRATGDYLIFLDGADTLVPGALQAITDRLKETDGPDLLVYDHARTHWSGEALRDQHAAQLSEEGPAAFELADRPGLLNLPAVVWNKAYSREFVEREGFAFAPGRYEDVPWTYPALLAADSIAVLDRVCVHHRQRRRSGIITVSTRSAGGGSSFGTGSAGSSGSAGSFTTGSASSSASFTAGSTHSAGDFTSGSTGGAGRVASTGGAGSVGRTTDADSAAHVDDTARADSTARTGGTARTGSLSGTATGREHFDVFGQYDRVFAFIDARPELSHWRPLVFRRMADHFTLLVTARGQLPRGSHGEFFQLARAHYRRHRAPGTAPRPSARLRHATVRLGSHRLHRALRAALRLRSSLRRRSAAFRRTVRAAVLQLHYRVQLRLPLRPDRAVFTAYAHAGYVCNPAAIEEQVRELAPHIHTSWIATPEHHHTVPTGTRTIRPDTFAHWTALARAKYLVNNVGFDPRLTKRPGQIVLQTQHGTPLKSMGLDLQDHPAAARTTDFTRLLNDVDKWDYCLSANRHSSLIWERAYPSGYTTLEYGLPRNDVFQRATATDVARLRSTLRIPEGFTALLYAPTHRDYRRDQLPLLDLDRISRALGPRVVILNRALYSSNVPFSRPRSARSGESPRIIDVSEHPSVKTLCLAADALITDYSSLMFDYANLDRPIVVHTDDWDAYEAARGTYFDLREFPPGAIARTEEELIDIFSSGHWRGSRSAQLRAAFRARFCAYDDGLAAERVVRHVFLGETTALPSVVPLEDRRPVPAAGPRHERGRDLSGLLPAGGR
ncbi:bifunctional glycosyltransferase family 2 protein/CDP-glycerol:glycerophosphate glycerophosphotransferase [Streptomyces sp. H27-C3]|uniref:bifunctional glycosyltransferase/CDP-glycerol:glycerophosphate glycerophosphotransferase n=1 Tax=Streptomyces sp. H27-C3 TaxID=3046305 RepID=UPI0024B9E96A|nr:bifunctional glycosyltransferase family 2 protein/CDP-glycerol:glycerophosphate glycerophosphotransferase [Streptomyces sp. H27-C3]MDJ0461198.1 bifunctional glycosyltransferase family 2 protein/CDP-glycerol:glycerophosphate glycerophosphotransferase [Streptomyces sp. H27-C3]